jgi:predicted metal-dependent phosphoesterase TrpH
MSVKADLHVHSNYSPDSLITPKDLIYYAKKRGLNAVAITDHNRVEGAIKIAKETDFLVIPGTEVSSQHGHIVGLNLHEVIPKGLTADETVERIHTAGGIAIACHPFALLKGSVGKYVTAKFDAVEVINASAFPFKRNMRKAQETAERLKLPSVAGTDAHYGPQIGFAYTLIDSELKVENVIQAILNGKCRPFGEAIPLDLKMKKQIKFYSKKILKSK